MKNLLTYPRTFIALHWGMALLIISMLISGWAMTELLTPPLKFQVYGVHKALGIAVFALVLWRVLYRARFTPPAIRPALPTWQHAASTVTHWALYVLMLAMPLSGWLMSSAGGYPISFFGLFTVPPLVAKGDPIGPWAAWVHELGLWAFIALLSLHAGAAVKHHFLKGDNTFTRMWFK